ncbi:MAG: 4-(cytidine 5'-diphospho)-2-C-methyl-D-erythritol kinase [Ruminococcaceae bacterium]|nr:4-(cytidine 5'-diphospho)-2-C-methyl-D-erythritol kinase [Oscillospiraceae bacterium]
MNAISLPSAAKINLLLNITGKRDDGYHDIESLMQTVCFGDTVHISKAEGSQIVIESNRADLPTDAGNIAYRAATLMQEQYGISCGFTIYLDKKIPVAAGLAGGSGNAAAVLHGINELCGLGLSMESLAQLGLRLGADVPFCLYGHPALATGIGEILTPVTGLSNCYIVLVNPGVGVSTGLIYQSLDHGKLPEAGDAKALVSALSRGDLDAAFPEMKNMMEPAAISYCPEIQDLIDRLRMVGADHAMMSGSGATCFGIFKKEPDEKELRSCFGNHLIAITKPQI